MKYKDGVSQDGLRPEIIKVLPALDRLWLLQTGFELTITCTTGSHPKVDPHPWGFAIDCRTHGLSIDKVTSLKHVVQNLLGPHYFVQYEPEVVENGEVIKGEHFHIQLRKDIWRAIVRSEGYLEIPEV